MKALIVFFLSFSFLNASHGDFCEDPFNDKASFVFEGWKSEIDESQTDMLLHLEDEFVRHDRIFESIVGITECHTDLLDILRRDVRQLRRSIDQLHEDMRLLLDTQ